MLFTFHLPPSTFHLPARGRLNEPTLKALAMVSAMSMAEIAKRGVFGGVKVSKLEEVSHEMLVLRFARVSWRVSGCAVTMGEAAMPYV